MINKMKLTGIGLLMAGSAFINVYFAFVLQEIIDIASRGSVDLLVDKIVFALFYLLADIIISMLRRLGTGYYIKGALIDLKARRMNASLSDTRSMGDVSQTMVLDMETLDRDYFKQLFNCAFQAIQVLMGLVAIVYISLVLTLGVALVTMIPLLVPMVLKTLVASRKDQFLQASKNHNAYLQEIEQGRYVIEDYQLKDYFKSRLRDKDKDLEHKRFIYGLVEAWSSIITVNLGMLTFITALGIGSYYVILGKMTFGMMIAAVQLMNSIVQPLNSIGYSLNRINSCKPLYKTYRAYKEQAPRSGIALDCIDSIQLRDVTYTYPDGSVGLENFSHTFVRGKTYGICGPSGSGKTTLINILSGQLEVSSGQVLINDVDMRDYCQQSIRDRFSIARQDTYLFTDTLEENVTLWGQLGQVDDQVLRMACLQDLYKDHQKKEISNLGGLSGGQKQRIGLVRALQRTADVYLMDEITSALDQKTGEKVLKRVLEREVPIQVFVSHDQSHQQFLDEVVIL